MLKRAGVRAITVVVGHGSSSIRKRLGTTVQMVVNPHYESTGNIAALWEARSAFQDDTLILNGDLVFGEDIITTLTTSSGPYSLAIDTARRKTGHIGMCISEACIIDVGRHITRDRSDAAFLCVGRVTGVGLTAFLDALKHRVRKHPHTGWSKAFLALAQGGQRIELCEYSGPWFDVNSVAVYRAALRFVTGETRTDTTSRTD